MKEKSKLDRLRDRANHFFKLTSINDNIVALPEDEYLAMTNCHFCGRKLHRSRNLLTDYEEGISAFGKRCPCCGAIYTTHRVMYALVIACSPEKLNLFYTWPVSYDLFKPLKGYREFLRREDVIFVEGNRKKDNSIKCKTSSKLSTNRDKSISIDHHPVIRSSSVVVIDDRSEYRSKDYAVQVMSKVTGKIFVMIIQAEYKKEPGHYFISKEEYERLFLSGIPLCRLIKKKDYIDRMKENNLDLKPQSILMDYGYNVSEQNHLSMLARHNILAMLIDADICSKKRIISYLTFFIKQRRSNQTMTGAIKKWEDDVSFVEDYTKGTLKKTWTKNMGIRQ